MVILPIRLFGTCKSYLWGGNRLRTYGKHSPDACIAESWELSAHPDGESRTSDGTPLTALFSSHPEWFGTHCSHPAQLPLVKLIDAALPLSVQVHPDDAYAKAHTDGRENGKTEMWYVLDAAEDAVLYYGVKEAVTREQLRAAIADETLEQYLNAVPVHRGDVFFIPPGTIHAIGSGILIAEIQQNSNLTYRMYDYGRTDAAGNPRELHIEQALDVAICTPSRERKPSPSVAEGITELAACAYFRVNRICCCGEMVLEVTEETFQHFLVTDGEGRLERAGERYELVTGDSILLPAGSGEWKLVGKIELMQTMK